MITARRPLRAVVAIEERERSAGLIAVGATLTYEVARLECGHAAAIEKPGDTAVGDNRTCYGCAFERVDGGAE